MKKATKAHKPTPPNQESEVTHFEICWYIPNIVRYLRFIFNMVAIRYAFDTRTEKWPLFIVFYSLSQGLDSIDGLLARKFNQCSRFGAAMDMISDRTSCACIYTILMMIYPERHFSYLFMTCLILDFGSHFLQFCTAALMKTESHKKDIDKKNFIVSYYYSNHIFFVSLVTFSEACSVCLVLMRRWEAFRTSKIAFAFTAFCCVNLTLKMIINVYQWKGAVGQLQSYMKSKKLK